MKLILIALAVGAARAQTSAKASKKGFVADIEKQTQANTGGEPLKLYTIYAPPQHADGTTQATKADAERAKEHFSGKTTE